MLALAANSSPTKPGCEQKEEINDFKSKVLLRYHREEEEEEDSLGDLKVETPEDMEVDEPDSTNC